MNYSLINNKDLTSYISPQDISTIRAGMCRIITAKIFSSTGLYDQIDTYIYLWAITLFYNSCSNSLIQNEQFIDIGFVLNIIGYVIWFGFCWLIIIVLGIPPIGTALTPGIPYCGGCWGDAIFGWGSP